MNKIENYSLCDKTLKSKSESLFNLSIVITAHFLVYTFFSILSRAISSNGSIVPPPSVFNEC